MPRLTRLIRWAASLPAAYAIHLAAFAALYALGSAVGPILYTYPAGRAAYNVMIASAYALAFLASMLVSARLLSGGVGLEWGIKYVAAPTLPYIALVGYLVAARDLAPDTSLQALRAGILYERLIIYVIAPTAASVKVLGERLGSIKSALLGVLAGGAAYAFVTYALAHALKPIQPALSALIPWGMGDVAVGLLTPVAALAIESLPLLLLGD